MKIEIDDRVALVLAQYCGHILHEKGLGDEEEAVALFTLPGFEKPVVLGGDNLAEIRELVRDAERQLLGNLADFESPPE